MAANCEGRAKAVMGVKTKGATKASTVKSMVNAAAKRAGHGKGTTGASKSELSRGNKKATK